jgi:hypothetical protein
MHEDDIAIQVSASIEHPPRVASTSIWPFQAAGAKVYSGFEGLPGGIGVYEASTRIGTRQLSVFVFFGRGRPTIRQLNRANTELRRARAG